ncbi:MAG: cation:proton antiporter regulatory subunit [Candidatus Wallacebacter cryptica]
MTKKKKRQSWNVCLIVVMRALTVGLAYFLIIDMPGLTSSFVAIFVGLLAFDLIVAMPKFSLRPKHWRELVTLLLPRITGTTITLARGLIIGAVVGGLAQLGLPVFLGGVLTIGLAYNMAERVKGNISTYVGMLAGLTVYDQIIRIPQLSPTLLMDMGGTILQVVYTTFTALFVGWACGVVTGVFTRLILPRGYKTVRSSAYDPPLSMQSIKSVLHVDETTSLMRVEVTEFSPLAHKTLAESGLRENYQATVFAIYRKEKDIVGPKGQEQLLPGDTLVLIMPTEQSEAVVKLVRGSELQSEQV